MAVLAGIAYAGMFALTLYVEPNMREMSVRIPNSRIDPKPVIRPQPAPASEVVPAEAAEDPDQTGTVQQ